MTKFGDFMLERLNEPEIETNYPVGKVGPNFQEKRR